MKKLFLIVYQLRKKEKRLNNNQSVKQKIKDKLYKTLFISKKSNTVYNTLYIA